MKMDRFEWERREGEWIPHDVESLSAEAVIGWGLEQFGPELVIACSLGAEDVVILHLVERLRGELQVPIFFIETALHFPETMQLKERWEERLGYTMVSLTSSLSLAEQAAHYGDKLWERNPNQCCTIRKVEPLRNYLQDKVAWVTGIRREQAVTRKNAKKVEWDSNFQLVKLNPLADWSEEQVWDHIQAHQLPYHPLHDQSYPSIGCAVCTRPVALGEELRAGRWSGHGKIECGLHG